MSDAPIVQVQQGQLQGRLASAPGGKQYYSFQGIPYARAPLGSLRFKAPQPAEFWDGVRDATAEGNVSAQIDPLIHHEFIGDENCLFLNVYTPNLDGEFLPVMLYIHGGGFRYGSGNTSLYGPDYLVEKDVVVVTINYRCGALGFLSLNTPEVPGNAGLKDIVQAVRWVKENIHNFGGNSGNLTVFGESAGGAAVSFLTASPLTKNLISKGIIQSGTGLNSWTVQTNPLENARNLAKSLGCESEDVDEILEFLRATSAKEIVEAVEKMYSPELFYVKASQIFVVVVEKEFPGVEAALTEPFIDLLTSGRVADVPIMIGSTTLEFTPEQTADDLQVFIPEDLHIQKNTETAIQIAEKIKQLYFKGKPVGVESLQEYYQLVSDKLVNIDTHRYVQYLVKVSNKPVYYYKFDYVGELNLTKKLISSLGLTHAHHMDELGYLFRNIFQKDVEPTPHDVKMRERLLRLWTNFAKSGNPTPDENHYLTVTWLPVTKDNLYYLNLSNELSVATNPDAEKMDFWDDVYSKHYKIWEQPQANQVPLQEAVQDEKSTEEVPPERSPTPVESTPVEPTPEVEPTPVIVQEEPKIPEPVVIEEKPKTNGVASEPQVNGNGIAKGQSRTSNEIKMLQNANGVPKDVIRASDPPEDDLPKNIGVNKFVNFFESLGGKKK